MRSSYFAAFIISLTYLILTSCVPIRARAQPGPAQATAQAQPPTQQAPAQQGQAQFQSEAQLVDYLNRAIQVAQRGGQYTQEEAQIINGIMGKYEELVRRGSPYRSDEQHVITAGNAIRAALQQQQGHQQQQSPPQQDQAPAPQDRWVRIVLSPYMGFGLGANTITPTVAGHGGAELTVGPTRYPVTVAVRLGLLLTSRSDLADMSRFAPDVAIYGRYLFGNFFDFGLGYHWTTYTLTGTSPARDLPNPMIHSALIQAGLRWSSGRVYVEAVPGYLPIGEHGGVHCRISAGLQIPIPLY